MDQDKIDAARYRLLRSLYIGINGAQSDDELLTGESLDHTCDMIFERESQQSALIQN